MRFCDVLTIDKNNGDVSFNISNLFQMRDGKYEDIAHLGKITRCSLLKKMAFSVVFFLRRTQILHVGLIVICTLENIKWMIIELVALL
jgi:hypothetical protein